MKIPEIIKIGGKLYTVEETDNLRLGSLNCTAECDYENIHEVVHSIADNLGYKQQDEQAVEAFAQALYAVIVGNQEVFCVTIKS
ncbi:MAG: hypothetical protein K2J73_08540 [Oscillospiraceae bacterium]|nr:hypothetical protein [Oscillospiraceae bacterium]